MPLVGLRQALFRLRIEGVAQAIGAIAGDLAEITPDADACQLRLFTATLLKAAREARP